jgi:RNA polymerase sigma factor (sigma-70 family)
LRNRTATLKKIRKKSIRAATPHFCPLFCGKTRNRTGWPKNIPLDFFYADLSDSGIINLTPTQNCRGPVAMAISPYPADLSWLVSDQEDGRRELEGKLRQAVNDCWTNACDLSKKYLRQPQPPDDLWEQSIKRTAVDVWEHRSDGADVSRALIHNFDLIVRRLRADQIRLVQLHDQDLVAPTNLENEVAAVMDLRKIVRYLGPAERKIILDRYLHQRSWRAMAADMGRTEDSVRKQCLRTLERLRERFG